MSKNRIIIIVIGVALIVAVQAAVLYWLGHPVICQCEYLKIWDGAIKGAENSQHLLDWYFFSHVIYGFIIYFFLWLAGARKRGWPLAAMMLVVLLASASWEIFENTHYVVDRYQQATISSNYYGDSIINSLIDTTAVLLGFALAWRLPISVTIILAVTMEFVAGAVIHDNLSLNAIMLIYPFEAILQWQSG
ncbi:MAG: hypothetical protein A3C50_02825 [Candidatus Staskawiczbacteria bacterium RIFCSPHIGHO2_02_FULL_43_16]|uniref:Uncharacterized protein n=1 Tax=Candidatus Staskawiczbacteria bacterium RIFCSPHIGHO2_01_FULL_41_41 TaxID=1802203 RepID=A0A1G2HSZ1_9BACT|nr:MAG: hypothetical protein A2822_03445 [Candidatus Staskawiczbacteria bacterium RIFCSPHIGHO2_01_FULL_41_41]OGZ68214.1 MAG: hypothetical protein A3C50_02825 [Candidatus Staskawiczbacteria bacterium RIFCSPHIGHO2_02_FULL_43_16]OGZ75003.1 MAG: hypothetical protein A3A12_04225 [Candidatus Staskawiczbacteria bacterium RIFCSPLOWO2_01_FULL_43_17b]